MKNRGCPAKGRGQPFLFLNVFADMSDIVTNWKNRIKGRDWHIRNLQKHEVFSALNLAELFE